VDVYGHAKRAALLPVAGHRQGFVRRSRTQRRIPVAAGDPVLALLVAVDALDERGDAGAPERRVGVAVESCERGRGNDDERIVPDSAVVRRRVTQRAPEVTADAHNDHSVLDAMLADNRLDL